MIRSLGDKKPKIHPTAFVSETAYVVGDVEIGEGSSIWPGTVIRGNLSKIKIGKYMPVSRIPIVNKIYSTIKGITDTISSQNKNAFQKVVIIQYPREGLWTYAMVTGECKNKNNEEYYNLFVPTTPNPTSGYLIIIKKNDVINTDISVDDGLSIIISGGMISPNTIDIK